MVVIQDVDVVGVDERVDIKMRQPCCKNVLSNKKSAPCEGTDPCVGRAGGI